MQTANTTSAVVMTEELQALINEKVADKLRDLDRSLAYHKGEIERIEKDKEEAAATVTARYLLRQEAIDKLKAAKFEVITHYWTDDVTVKVQQRQLKHVYKAIGRLDANTMYKDVVDEKKRRIRVTITSAHYPMVDVVFERTLKKTDKCKLVTVKSKRLVCEN